MILMGETAEGTAGRDAEGYPGGLIETMNGGVLAPPNLHRIERPHVLKISVQRAEYSLTENVASPFQAEPRHRGRIAFFKVSFFFSVHFVLNPELEIQANKISPFPTNFGIETQFAERLRL